MKKLTLILSIILLTSCNMKIEPPKAEKIPFKHEIHGDVRIDNYYWLNERDNDKVIDYLNNENSYTDKILKPTQKLQDELFQEMKSRIKEDDISVPYYYNDYWYMRKYEKGKDYPVYLRKYKSLDADEELLVDVNELAKGYSYFQLRGISISPDNKKMAYAVDTLSRRIYTIKIKNLETGEMYNEQIKNTTGGSTWANDNKTLFYSSREDVTLRVNKVHKHKLGSDISMDELVYEEKDKEFSTGVYKTKSNKFLVIGSGSTLTSEVRYIDADNPSTEPKLFLKRVEGHEYSIDHYKNDFYIKTNVNDAYNFKIMRTSTSNTKLSAWKDLVKHRENVLIEDMEIFDDYFVIVERNDGLMKINIKSWSGKKDYYLPLESETYDLSLSTNLDFSSKLLRYNYTSFTTPSSVIDFDMNTMKKNVLKKTQVMDETFNESDYVSERIFAESHDGVEIPISIVRHIDTEFNESTPLLLYGYGSYGITNDPRFSSTRLSLLNRGFVYATAHIRGSEYFGKKWYEDGKLFKKKNTFLDFVASAKHLININYTSSDHIYAMGGSAGGLLMGAVLNLEPTLFNGVISAVPFVDVMTTMLDETIPLTTLEYDEWGNPNEKDYYDYMRSYSPYDNLQNTDYTNILVTTGLHDSQVQYFEPAKWVAKLRDLNTSDNKILLQTNMDTGHGGASGRFESLKEVALDYAFFIGLEMKSIK